MAEENGYHSENEDEYKSADSESEESDEDTPRTYTQEDFDKALEAERAETAKFKRMSEQRAKKLEGNSKGVEYKKSEGSIGYAEKAFLNVNGIKGEDELQIVQEAMKFTNKNLEDIIESNYVKLELKALREQRATEEATPKGSNRSGSSSRTNIDYWIAKGELPPSDQVELRRKVVNEKLRVSQQKSKFAQSS